MTAFVGGICGRKPKILNSFSRLGLSYKLNCIPTAQTNVCMALVEYDFVLIQLKKNKIIIIVIIQILVTK